MRDFVIVLNKDDDTVSFIDEDRREVAAVVPVEKNPHEVAATADGRKAFVSNAGANSITVFDMTTLKIIDTIRHPEFQFPHEGKITGDSRLILARGNRFQPQRHTGLRGQQQNQRRLGNRCQNTQSNRDDRRRHSPGRLDFCRVA